jgi:hypothetical protein
MALAVQRLASTPLLERIEIQLKWSRGQFVG